MAEETAGTDHVEPTDRETGPQGAEGGKPTDWKAEARKWEERAKANKAKADQWDAQEEASKTELQKANELAEKYKRQLDGIAAERKRAEAVKAAAEKYRVDADMLSRMGGDVEENAKWLSEREGAEPAHRYPRTRDKGESGKNTKADAMLEAAHMMFGRKQ